MRLNYLVVSALLTVYSQCSDKSPQPNPQDAKRPVRAENIIIVVMDGPRYSETWGDPTHQNIPRMANEMAKEGAVFTNFYNSGPTYTNAGHSTITTGNRQEIDNLGNEFPEYPSIFQYYLKKTGKEKQKAWIITSKDKLEILANTNDENWKDKYLPSTDCGQSGLRSGYKDDSVTFQRSLDILKKHHPNLVLVNFKEPDATAHTNNWPGYLQGIKDSDEYIWKLWTFIKTDTFYQDRTAFFVTNDHGRHLDDVKEGFSNHGCHCQGCEHINLYAYGPGITRKSIDRKYALQDITATAAYLLDLRMPHSEGEIMKDLWVE